MKKNNVVTKTSFELAEELGLAPVDAMEWEVRHSLENKIAEVVKKESITVTELAKLSRTSRARITKILQGNTLGISLDVLFRVLGATGQGIKISYKKVA